MKIVIRGLDPLIHQSSKLHFVKKMHWVESGNDETYRVGTGLSPR